MGFFNKIKETLRDKTRDKVCTRLCAIGADSLIAERGRPEEKLGCSGLQRSLGLIEIHEEPISWVNVITWQQIFPANMTKYRNVYVVHDPNLSTKSKLHGNEIGRQMKDNLLLNLDIRLRRDIEIQVFPDNECWAILSEEYTGDEPRPFIEQWSYLKAVAHRLLESSRK